MQQQTDKKPLSIRRFIRNIIIWTVIPTGCAAALAIAQQNAPVSNDFGSVFGNAIAVLLYQGIAFFSPLVVSCGALVYALRHRTHDTRYVRISLIWMGCVIVFMVVTIQAIMMIGTYVSQRNAEQYTLSQRPYSQEVCDKYETVAKSIAWKKNYFHADTKQFTNIRRALDSFSGELDTLSNRVSRDTYCTSYQPNRGDIDTLESVIAQDSALSTRGDTLKSVLRMLDDWVYITNEIATKATAGQWQEVVRHDGAVVEGYTLHVQCQADSHQVCKGTSWVSNDAPSNVITNQQMLDMIYAKIAQKDKELQQ